MSGINHTSQKDGGKRTLPQSAEPRILKESNILYSITQKLNKAIPKESKRQSNCDRIAMRKKNRKAITNPRIFHRIKQA
ncbi:hypothetical protein [Bartonella sp. OT172YNZD]|uniref:hypothetical protein n=1 Tax=Bartonella sp. OT172YNZD TaxID=3243572 RepID=UPI0035CF8406